ncbi:MAG: hypothetical protein Q8P67_13760, partial [archaeon]|nr:hypothetical protein [archaeon]
WELPQVDASGCYTIAYQLHNVDHWIAVGWAPECLELDRKQYNKYGCYLTSTGFTVGPAGTPQIGIAPENRGKYMAIRMRYDPSEHTCMWHDCASGVVGELLGRFNEVSIYPPMFPTICFGHQGGQVTMLGSSRMNLRNRTASECTTSSASVLERSMMSHTSLASESEPDRSISMSTSGC